MSIIFMTKGILVSNIPQNNRCAKKIKELKISAYEIKDSITDVRGRGLLTQSEAMVLAAASTAADALIALYTIEKGDVLGGYPDFGKYFDTACPHCGKIPKEMALICTECWNPLESWVG